MLGKLLEHILYFFRLDIDYREIINKIELKEVFQWINSNKISLIEVCQIFSQDEDIEEHRKRIDAVCKELKSVKNHLFFR